MFTSFDGSAGIAIVPADSASDAILFVDSRYWIIAEHQIPKQGWVVNRVGSTGQAGRGSVIDGWTGWMVKTLDGGSRVGIDPKLISATVARAINEQLEEAGKGTKLVPLSDNLVDKARSPSPRPLGPMTPHPMKYAGEEASSKLARMREVLMQQTYGKEWMYILPGLNALAWLLNFRCRTDIVECPVAYAYLALTEKECVLFVDDRKLPDETRSALDDCGVTVRPYGVDEVGKYVTDTGARMREKNEKARFIVYGSSEVSWGLNTACGGVRMSSSAFHNANVTLQDVQVIQCPVEVAKAIKNPIEIQGYRNCYLRDGRAMVRWLSWLGTKLMKENREIGEWAAGQTLARFRMREDLFV